MIILQQMLAMLKALVQRSKLSKHVMEIPTTRHLVIIFIIKSVNVMYLSIL